MKMSTVSAIPMESPMKLIIEKTWCFTIFRQAVVKKRKNMSGCYWIINFTKNELPMFCHSSPHDTTQFEKCIMLLYEIFLLVFLGTVISQTNSPTHSQFPLLLPGAVLPAGRVAAL